MEPTFAVNSLLTFTQAKPNRALPLGRSYRITGHYQRGLPLRPSLTHFVLMMFHNQAVIGFVLAGECAGNSDDTDQHQTEEPRDGMGLGRDLLVVGLVGLIGHPASPKIRRIRLTLQPRDMLAEQGQV